MKRHFNCIRIAFMSVSGERGKRMVWESYIFLMAVHTADTLRMVLPRVKADFFIQMVMFMLVNGKMIKLTDMEHITQ